MCACYSVHAQGAGVHAREKAACAAQVEREAGLRNERHGWLVEGEAWGYRRRAYRRMAEMLGGPALASYDEVFGREPASTRHYESDWTPDLDKPAAAVAV